MCFKYYRIVSSLLWLSKGWLERYTYCRSGNSLLVTYFVSALWHGLYPGYFLFFLSMPLLTNVERLFRLKLNPLVIPGYDGRDMRTAPHRMLTSLYWGICIIGTSLSVSYMAQVKQCFLFVSCSDLLLLMCVIDLSGFFNCFEFCRTVPDSLGVILLHPSYWFSFIICNSECPSCPWWSE